MEQASEAHLVTTLPIFRVFINRTLGLPVEEYFPWLCQCAMLASGASHVVVFTRSAGLVWPMTQRSAFGSDRFRHPDSANVAHLVLNSHFSQVGLLPAALPLFEGPECAVFHACFPVIPMQRGRKFALYMERPASSTAFTPSQIETLRYLAIAAGVNLPKELYRLDHGEQRVAAKSPPATPLRLDDDESRAAAHFSPAAPLRHDPVARQKKFGLRHPYPDIVGDSRAIIAMLRELDLVVETEGTVLLQGESGSGKELVARAIAREGVRRDKLFEAHNAAAIPKDLLESLMFGYEKGAFNNAHQTTPGIFERCHEGTVFLDELGDMDILHQPKIFRAIECHEVWRVGGRQALKCDVRVIGGTSKDLDAAVKAGTFRRDLYYRIDDERIHVPPLRDRKEDIPLLLQHVLKDRASIFGAEALKVLNSHDWPGNVRELFQVARRVNRRVARRGGDTATAAEVRAQIRGGGSSPTSPGVPAGPARDFKTLTRDQKRAEIQRLLPLERADLKAVAKRIGYRLFSLKRLMKRLKISIPVISGGV